MLPDRIASKINVDDNGCWLWTAHQDGKGYGGVRIGGRSRRAHRVVYEELVGPIPEGLHLDHLCRVRHCVNPAHLEPVTCRENLLRGNTAHGPQRSEDPLCPWPSIRRGQHLPHARRAADVSAMRPRRQAAIPSKESSVTVRNEVEKREQAPAKVSNRDAIRGIVDKNLGAIGASLPSGMTRERFSRLLITAANTNPELFDCSPTSFLQAGIFAAQLGLEPNDPRGLAYLVPFNDRKRGKVVVFIPGYRGLMELARRSGMVTSIHAFAVFEGDTFSYRFGLDPSLEHVPSDHDEDPAKLTHVYAVAKVGGDPQFVVLTRRQVEKAKSSSKGASSDYSPWRTNYVEMALKTAIRRLCKYLPQTVEMAHAIAAEDHQLVVTGDGLVGPSADDDDVIDADSEEVDLTGDGVTEQAGP